MIYCVEVKKEFGDEYIVAHYDFSEEPTEKEVFKALKEDFEQINSKYDEITYYPINVDKIKRIEL